MKKIILFFILFFAGIFVVNASDITKSSNVTINNKIVDSIIDNNEKTYKELKTNESIDIISKINIDSLYIEYEFETTKGGVYVGDNRIKTLGENGFIHEYVDISSQKTNHITLKFDENVKITEVYVINGKLPNFVEIWEAPCDGNTDLLVFPTHSDDDQLFFAGLIPTYVDKGANVQVVYFIKHYNNKTRYHELLHGLYTSGTRFYPVISDFPDAYSTSIDVAIQNLKKGNYTVDDALKWEVEMIRRFKPSVIAGHDINGEYGHGQHILNTFVLQEAIYKAEDENYDEESYEKYGTWSTPKVYLHLYNKNKIELDLDKPLKSFDGKTAYQVSVEAFMHHKSQFKSRFPNWLLGKNREYTKSTDINTYSPREYGLYRTLVGNDKKGNDMFENISTKKEQKEIDIKNQEKVIIEGNSLHINLKKVFLDLIILFFITISAIVITVKTKHYLND